MQSNQEDIIITNKKEATKEKKIYKRGLCACGKTRKDRCKECGGSGLCEKHGVDKYKCAACKAEAKGEVYPPVKSSKAKRIKKKYVHPKCVAHGIRLDRCKDCDGRARCVEHNIEKYRCKLCKNAKLIETDQIIAQV